MVLGNPCLGKRLRTDMQNDGQDIGIERSEGEIPNWRSTSMPGGDRSLTIRRLRSSKLFGLVAKLASGRDATIGTSNLPIEQRITQFRPLRSISSQCRASSSPL